MPKDLINISKGGKLDLSPAHVKEAKRFVEYKAISHHPRSDRVTGYDVTIPSYPTFALEGPSIATFPYFHWRATFDDFFRIFTVKAHHVSWDRLSKMEQGVAILRSFSAKLMEFAAALLTNGESTVTTNLMSFVMVSFEHNLVGFCSLCLLSINQSWQHWHTHRSKRGLFLSFLTPPFYYTFTIGP